MKAIVFFLFIPALFAAKISHKMGTLELVNPPKKVVALEFSFRRCTGLFRSYSGGHRR